MKVPYLFLCLFCQQFAWVSGALAGAHVDFKETMKTDPKMRLMLPDMMPSEDDDKIEGAYSSEKRHNLLGIQNKHKNNKQVTVMTSWILFHVRGDQTGSVKQPILPKLVSGLRNAVADTLEVCRSSVGMIDVRAINFGMMRKGYGYGYLSEDNENNSSQAEGSTEERLFLNEHRNMRAKDNVIVKANKSAQVNLTQIKAVYEVRIFEEMHVHGHEVRRRMDMLQMYSRFFELNRMLERSLSDVDGYAFNDVILDDVGYAYQEQVYRPPLSHDEMLDCTEEVALHDARQIHSFIVAVSLLMVALITCAGSTVFTIKHASSVPSRMNPLVQSTDN